MMKVDDIPTKGYERVVRCQDPASGLKAVIAVHDTTLGPALGGLRMWPYASWEDATFDVLRLAKGMTYKSAVAETGLGGGKSVILGNPKTDKSEALFRAMGRFIEYLGGTYITAEDVGTSVDDMVVVRKETRWVTGLPREMRSSGDPSPWTALGVFRGMKACLEEAFGSGEFQGRVVAIQGCGNVGYHLAKHLAEVGAKLKVSDVAREKAKRLAQETGAEVVDPGEILRAECDVLAPCALGAVVNDESLPRLRTKIVAGAANNVLLREEHGKLLKDAGILYAPDYVINAGGIINVSIEVEPKGYDPERSRRKVENIYVALRRVFEIARREGISTNQASNRLAEERLAQGRRQRQPVP
jgi:leucine dehydrogenase